MKRIILAGAALLALAGIAAAADLTPLPVKAPIVAPVSNFWQDCYVTALSGGVTGANQTGTPTVGGLVGCNYQTGVWVYGFEGSAAAAQATQGPAPKSVDIKALGDLAVRAGYAWHGNLNFGPFAVNDALIYAKAAVPANVIDPGAASSNTIKSGWGLAGGVEYVIRPYTTMRYEYRFQDVDGNRAHVFLTGISLYYSGP